MTDIVELLNSMSSTFNSDCATSTAEGGSLLNLDLAEDKTVKWRNLANNQFACKDKEKKQSQPRAGEDAAGSPATVEKQQEAAETETNKTQQQRLLDADVKQETTSAATEPEAEAEVTATEAEAEAETVAASDDKLPAQGQSQSQSKASDAGADADEVTAEKTDAAATETAAAAAAEAAESVTGKTTQAETVVAAAAAAAATSASTPNEAMTAAAAAAAALADNENDGNGDDDDADVAERKSEAEVDAAKGDGDATSSSDDNVAATTKTATTAAAIEKHSEGEEGKEEEAAAAAANEEETTNATAAAAAVKVEQESATTTTTAAAAQISDAAAATETTTTTTTVKELITPTTTTTTTAEGIKTETEMENANATPKEEFLEEQQKQKEEEEEEAGAEEQQKSPQTPEAEEQMQLTAQIEPQADAAAAAAAATAEQEVVTSSTGDAAASSTASPTLPTSSSSSAVVVAPLVVNAVDVASGAADATVSTTMNAAAVTAVSDDVAAAASAEATTTATAATTAAAAAVAVAADKNEQSAAGSTRRLRRTPRPTDTPTPTTTPTPTATPTGTSTTPVSIDSDQQDQQEQQTESQPDALPVPTECSATSPINGVKKEPEKSAPEAAAIAPDEVTTNAVAPAVPKRGRGRAKKIKPDADATLELTEASTVSTQTATANDEATSSTPTPPPATASLALERKVGRGKRKLPEEEGQQLADLPAAALIVKTEQDEDIASVSAPPSGDAKRMRRSVRLGNRQDLYKPTDSAATAAANSWSAEEVVKSEPLVATELASNVEPSLSVATGALLDEKTPPKKRGRKAKVPATASNPAAALQSLPHATTSSAMMTASGTVMAVAGNSSSGGGGGGGGCNNGGANIVVTLPNGNKRSATAATLTTLTATGSGELQLPKRSKRRIKPTTKILENDELRCEFETKHIERMTHWEATAAEGEPGGHFETPTLQQTFSGGGGGGGSNSSTSRQKSEKSDGGGSGGGGGGLGEHHPAGTSAIKKRLFSKSQRDIDNSGAALVALSLLRPCPDLEQFMNEIKASKWNANRSPEERKLNKKQQRKLAKRKEKHLKYLGLRRNNSEEASDNDSSNTDNEEFVPTTRVQVGKPSVTLRQRNAGKEARQSLAAAASSSLPAAPASLPGGKLTRRVGAVRGGAASAAAAAAASTTLEQSQLHSLNSAILAGNNNNAGDGLGASTSTAAAAAVKFICLCQKGSQYYARNAPDASFCCAIDNIDEQKIGCCNELSAEVHNLLRPSQRVGYMILCDEHKKRLQAHNCCAGCGIFCTQGKFVLCKQQHFFHPDCAQRFILNSPYDAEQQQQPQLAQSMAGGGPMLVLKCPHCGLDTPERTSTVTMKCQTLPVFLPAQKAKIKPAKLTTSSHLTQFANAAGNSGGNSKKSGSGAGNAAKASSGTARGSKNAGGQDVANYGSKSNGTRGHGKATPSSTNGSSNANALNVINFEQLLPESVMNVVLRGGMVSSSGRVTTEFNSRDMFYAVQNDDLERVAEILAADYNVLTRMREFLNGTCLHLVAHSGTLQMAYLLLCKGASSQDFVNIVDSELRTALMCAVMNEKCDMLNLFLQCGADVAIKGPDGMTCLHIAAKQGNLEAAQLIVDSYRASHNIASFLSFINAQDEGGWTAMVWAAELGHTDIVSLLINNDADPNICDNDNNTVLHWSTLHNDGLETITVLLQAGADCNVQNVEGDTPLHIACRHSVTRMCIALIANGADLMIKNRAEQLPYDCIPNEESECGRTVGFNMQMRSFRPLGLRTRVVCADASNGRELRPIQAVRNELTMSEHEDEADALMWPDFKYIVNCIILQNSVQIDRRVSQMRICSCLDSCSSDLCQCNGASSQNWYTAESRLNCDFNYDDPAVIFECNDVCGCNQLSCKNRVVQNGTRTPLQIVECEEQAKGWGVRALANVPKGTFVASYTGEILTAPEADRRTDDSYYFDLDNGHCIDANYYGNVSRFFNHSCEPNILPVRVFYEHQDYRFPKIAFFACRDIDAGEEICYDYGEKFWRADHRVNGGGCKCLTASCKYASHSANSNASPLDGAAAEEDPLACSPTESAAAAGASDTQDIFHGP